MLTITPDARDELITHARDGTPREICGVLGGEIGEHRRVQSVHRTPNVAAVPRTRYEIDPEAQLAAMTTIEDAGQEVVGFYHSHPQGPDAPSQTDVATASWPGKSYVVVSLGGDDPHVGAWRWTGDRFERETVEIR
jgi:proteasome lid subunit RPN8/RPN11